MSPEDMMALRFGGATVAENLRRLAETGKLIENDDGTLELPALPKNQRINWVHVRHGPSLDCGFLSVVGFAGAYARKAVPYGCRECFKLKVSLRTLRQLVATWQIAKSIKCLSKWGIDFYNPMSQDVYAGYFYTSGLDAARVLFKTAREAFAADPNLGPDIPMTIKRGCSEYEAAVGPSDRYEFTPEMAELEAYLKSRFRDRPALDPINVALAFWIDFAFRMGDDTYLDFTGGKRLRPKTLTYDPSPAD